MNLKFQEYLRPVCDIMDETMYGSASAVKTLESWADNKKHFYNRFNGKTILKTDKISLEFTDEREITRGFIDFRNKAEEFFDEPYKFELLLNFLHFSVGRVGFKDNQVKSTWDSEKVNFVYYDILIPEISPIKINKGMKFSRALKFFFDLKGENKEEQEEKLKELQDIYSTYRQNFSSRSDGNLFLSIHPLDYLTISDNNHNWSSCHSMYDGEYRMGNLNYMADGVTMVAYYASDDKFDEELDIYPERTWNSKRWRVLVHLEEVDGKLNVIYNKQYPFKSNRLLKELDNLIMETYVDSKPSVFLEYEDNSLNSLRLYNVGYDLCAYSDIGRQNGCHVRIDEGYLNKQYNIPQMTIGKAVYCIECGQNITTRGETGQCDNCCDEWYCENCDGRYYGDDMIWVDSEERYVCYDCYDNFHVECPECGKEVGNENMKYNELTEKNMCIECWEEVAGREGTIIFTINDMGRQIFEGDMDKEQAEKVYDDIYKEERKTIEKYRCCDHEVWPIGVVKKFDNGWNSWFNKQMNQARTNRAIASIDGLYWDSSFKRLEYQADSIPLLKNIIILGSTNQKSFDEYLQELKTSLYALGMKKEVNVDYSRVRII